MSVVVARGRSRSRSTGKGKRRAFQSASRSLSQRGADGNDGPTKRGWGYAQGVSTMFDPFPAFMRANLRYSETFTLNPGVAANAHQLFRCGSIFDPNFALGGHQPYGTDTYALIFNHYRVIKSVCKVTCTTVSNTSQFGITLTDDSTVSGNYDTVREVKPTKWCVMGSGTEPKSLAQIYVAKNVFRADTGTKTTALFTANPADEYFFDIFMQGVDVTGDVGAGTFTVCIDYLCEFTELKDQGQS